MGRKTQADTDGLLPELFRDDQWRELAEHLKLTPRQQQIARLLCRGCTNRQMATRLGISAGTVRMHLRTLFEKLEVHDRLGLAVHLVRTERKLSEADHGPGSKWLKLHGFGP
jgi:DNA-binding NarL/FixJ family response regulator